MDSRTAKRQMQQEGQYQQPQRNSNFKILLLAMVLIGAFFWVMDKEKPSSSNYEASNTRFCSLHSTTYSVKNTWGGCPKCANAESARKAAEGMEEKLYGRKRR